MSVLGFSLGKIKPDVMSMVAGLLLLAGLGIGRIFIVQLVLGTTLVGFAILMLGISVYASRKVENETDFIIAGRGLSPFMTIGTIMATWFGAGTLLVSADTVRAEGLIISGLEPLGVGFSLFFVGWFFAKRLWHSDVLTLADIYRDKFGVVTEKLSALYGVSYFGWIAAQVMGLAGILELFFGLDITYGVVLITTLLTAYTILGGMWSVAITDVIQLGLLLAGICMLTYSVIDVLGGGSVTAGLDRIAVETPPEKLEIIPIESLERFTYWVGLFLVGSLGNLAAPDLVQRILAARTPEAASRACNIAGFIYIVFASLPLLLGLSADMLLGADTLESVVPALASKIMSPAFSVVFVLTLAAAVTSTVDSAMLGSASVFSKNLIHPLLGGRLSLLATTRLVVILIAVMIAAIALSDVPAFDLLQGSYSLGIPLFVVLTFALYQRQTHALSGIVTLLVGLLVWVLEYMAGLKGASGEDAFWSGPAFPIYYIILCFIVYLASHAVMTKVQGSASQTSPEHAE